MSNEAKDNIKNSEEESQDAAQAQSEEVQDEAVTAREQAIEQKLKGAQHGKISFTARIPIVDAVTVFGHYHDHKNDGEVSISEGVFFADLIKKAVYDAQNPTKQAVEVREVEVIKEVEVPVEVLVEKTWADYLPWVLAFVFACLCGYLFYRLKRR